MSPLKKSSIIHNLQRRKTQLIFTTFLLIFSLIIFLNFSITSNSLTSITENISTTIPTSTSPLLSASYFISSFSSIYNSSTIIAAHKITPFENGSNLVNPVENGSDFVTVSAKKLNHTLKSSRKKVHNKKFVRKKRNSCDIFDGKWVLDDSDPNPIYPPGSCPFLDYTFNCFNNGRPDLGYLRYRWQPHKCDTPRFEGKKLLEMLRGKRMVFVGDSLNRNMWESMVCSLRMSLVDKNQVFEVSGRKQFRAEGFYSFKFQDYNCTIEFIRSPFLVQEWKFPIVKGVIETRREMLRLDLIQATTTKYHNADFLIFNTGHWWTHQKTRKGNNFFQEGDKVHSKLEVTEAYTKALRTWAKWVDKNVNKNKTKVFFAGYSANHFRGGQWNSGGNCDGETEPITNDKFLAPYPWMMRTLESVIAKMKTPVVYLNITKMTDYRKDAHPSIYRQPGTERQPGMIQDCSHWCLPGVPDSWNQLLYASLLMNSKKSSKTH